MKPSLKVGRVEDEAVLIEAAARGFAEGLLHGIRDLGGRVSPHGRVGGGFESSSGAIFPDESSESLSPFAASDVRADERSWFRSPVASTSPETSPDVEELARLAAELSGSVRAGYTEPRDDRDNPHTWSE